MYFVLSKVLLFLLYPAFWVFMLFVLALLLKNTKRKRSLLIIATALLYFFSVPIFLNFFGHAWSVKTSEPGKERIYSCVIILGGFTSVDRDGKGFFNGASDRFIEGVKLYNTGFAKKILISGGNGNLVPGVYKEAAWVKTQLLAFNVPDSNIVVESNSRNAIENAAYSKVLLQKMGLKPPYLLVTSDFHMRRAQMLFEKQGVPVVPYPCDFIVNQNNNTWGDLIPDGGAFSGWNVYLKELVGYVVDRWK